MSNITKAQLPEQLLVDYGIMMIMLQGVISLIEPNKRRAALRIVDKAIGVTQQEIVTYSGGFKR